MSKGHICFITKMFSRQDSLIVVRQGASLVESGYEVSYLLCDGHPKEVRNGISMESIDTSFSGSVYYAFSKFTHLKPRYETWLKNRRLLELIESHPADIYQINDYELVDLGLKLKKRNKVVTFNLREYYPIYLSFRRRTKIGKIIAQWNIERKLRTAASKYDGFFNCMPELHDYVYERMPCKVFEDVANFPVVNKNFNLSYDEYCTRENIISYFGTIYSISCQESIIKALEKIPNIKYLLAGVFYDKSYQNKLMKMPAWVKVDFRNGFKREELPAIINCSIIGNAVKDFSKTDTPQGSYSIIKIFETMEAAVPVILAKVPLYEEMVDKYHCGICVDPNSPEEFYKAIIYLMEHKQEAYQMGQNGRRAVLEEFSWDSQYARYLYGIQCIINELKNHAQ